jgi:hypothetical protein
METHARFLLKQQHTLLIVDLHHRNTATPRLLAQQQIKEHMINPTA